MKIDVHKLEAAIEELKGQLKEGLIATDIWDRQTGLSLAAFNSLPTAVALFTQIVKTLGDTLQSSGFPKMKRYFFIELEDDKTTMIILHGNDLLQGIVLDTAKVNLGLLLVMALPATIEAVRAARS
jgi:hypothetical protein